MRRARSLFAAIALAAFFFCGPAQAGERGVSMRPSAYGEAAQAGRSGADAGVAGSVHRRYSADPADHELRGRTRAPRRNRIRRAEPAPSLTYAGGSAAQAFLPGAITVRRKGLSAGEIPPDELDDYAVAGGPVIADPLEPWNRFWFRFNDILYLGILKPVYRGWEYVTPRELRSGLKNFLHNVLFPVRFVNNLLQFRFLEAGVEFGRFMMNTMVSAGFMDLAKDKKTIVPVDPDGEDFGQTLGYWGIGHGCYIVWPLLGPSSIRETVGRVGDWAVTPFTYLQPWEAAWGVNGGLRFNDLDSVLPMYEDLSAASVDPYIAMREAYINYRNEHVKK